MNDVRQSLFLDAHPDIEMADLLRIDHPLVICEGEFKDSDGVPYYVYTVAGELDGRRVELIDHQRKVIMGATVGGDAIIVHARDRKEADWLAINGLTESISSMLMLALSGELDPGPNAGTIVETQVRPKGQS